jgi:hypothetical protein
MTEAPQQSPAPPPSPSLPSPALPSPAPPLPPSTPLLTLPEPSNPPLALSEPMVGEDFEMGDLKMADFDAFLNEHDDLF